MLFLSAVVGAYLAYLAISGQMGTFADALSSVDAGWVLRACLCFASYWVFGVLAYVIAVYLDHDSPVGVRDLMSVEASGVFFGSIVWRRPAYPGVSLTPPRTENGFGSNAAHMRARNSLRGSRSLPGSPIPLGGSRAYA